MTKPELFFEQQHILENDLVRLEPLEEHHFELLLPVAMESSLWLFTTAKIISEQDFKNYFNTAIEDKKNKRSYPFAYFNKVLNQYVGCTRFGNIDFANKKMEIGWTWLQPSLQGTGFNKHCKFLLLSFVFETLDLNRIEFKTNLLNLKSQKALMKIGAKQEGVFRKHIINDDGIVRDSVYFSIINDDWPAFKNSIFSDLAT